MDKATLLIPDINADTKNWTARVTLTESISEMTCRNNTKLKRYIFTDSEGNEITGSIYGNNIPIISPMLHLFKVYEITNAQVLDVKEEYRTMNNPYQWRLQKDNIIRPIADAKPTVQFFLRNITPLSVILSSKELQGKTVDTMGIIIKAEERRPANVTSCFQRFTIVDTEKKAIPISLWGEVAINEGLALENAANNFSVIVAKRVKVGSFNERIVLSSKNCSSFTIDPPIEAAAALKSWFDSVREYELNDLLRDNTIEISRDLVKRGLKKVHTIAELESETKCGDYWVRGFLSLSDKDQKLYYIGCGNCYSKIKAEEGVEYPCLLCKKTVIATPRPIVVLTVSDHTNAMKIIAIDAIAEKIVQTTAPRIADLMKMGQQYDLDPINAELENKFYLILLRRTYGQTNVNQRRHLLIAYYDETFTSGIQEFGTSTSTPTGKGKAVELSLSPLKRQMSQITIQSDSIPSKRQLIMPTELQNQELQINEDTPDDSTV